MTLGACAAVGCDLEAEGHIEVADQDVPLCPSHLSAMSRCSCSESDVVVGHFCREHPYGPYVGIRR